MAGKRGVVAPEMMATVHLDYLGAGRFQVGADAVVVVAAVHALQDPGRDPRHVGERRMRSVAVHAEPTADVELEQRPAAERQQRHDRHAFALGRRQPIIGRGQHVGAEGIADQRHMMDVPDLAVVIDDLDPSGAGT